MHLSDIKYVRYYFHYRFVPITHPHQAKKLILFIFHEVTLGEIPCLHGSLDTAFVGRLRKFSWDMTTDLRYRRFDVSRYLIIVGWNHPSDDR